MLGLIHVAHFIIFSPMFSQKLHVFPPVPGAELPQRALHLSRGGHQLDVAAATSSMTGRSGFDDPEVCVIQIEGLADWRFRTEVQLGSEGLQAFEMRNSKEIEAGFNGQIHSSAFNHSLNDANIWPRKTKAARIPNGVLRTSWRQCLLQRPTSVPSWDCASLCDAMSHDSLLS